MRCEGHTKSGARCTRKAARGERLCASHLGRCGARPGNRNALKHGFYSQHVQRLRKRLAEARDVGGLEQEIALCRVEILATVQSPDFDAVAFVQLVNALRAALLAQKKLSGDQADEVAGALGTILETVATELGLES